MKKAARNFDIVWYVPRPEAWAPTGKSFLLLFFKKEVLPPASTFSFSS
jgi:hypothetical protein